MTGRADAESAARLGGGRAAGRAVLPEGWVEAATKTQIPTGYPGIAYGYMWWINPDGSYQASGIYGQSILIVPAERFVVVINAAWPNPGTPSSTPHARRLLRPSGRRPGRLQGDEGSPTDLRTGALIGGSAASKSIRCQCSVGVG